MKRDCIVTVCGTGESDDGSTLQIERGATATAYSPYGIKGTFPIHAEVREMCPGYGWSAGTVCNEIDFVRKVYVQRVGSVDLGTLEWVKQSNGRFQNQYGIAHFVRDYLSVSNCLCPLYSTTSPSKIEGSNPPDKSCSFGGNRSLLNVVDSSYADEAAFKAAMQGVLLYYELAKPVEVDLSDVLPDDHFIEVEAGGTITFKQASTQLPVPSSVTYQISTKEVVANA